MPGSDAAEIFGEIYRTNAWGGSGGGSEPAALSEYIALVDRLMIEYRPRSVLDIGCGLAHASARINWLDAVYLGIDVVPSVVRAAKANMPRGLFYTYDAITDRLPPADFVILKEVTQHLDNASIDKLILNLAGFYRRILHVSAVVPPMNHPSEMGATRGVDLTAAPFSQTGEHLLDYSIGDTRYLCQLWEPGVQLRNG